MITSELIHDKQKLHEKKNKINVILTEVKQLDKTNS